MEKGIKLASDFGLKCSNVGRMTNLQALFDEGDSIGRLSYGIKLGIDDLWLVLLLILLNKNSIVGLISS